MEIFLLLNLLMTVMLWEMYLQWATFLDSEGRVMDPEALKKRIFYGGLEHSLRKEVLMSAAIFIQSKSEFVNCVFRSLYSNGLERFHHILFMISGLAILVGIPCI
jgi:hypothetical protein